MTGDVILRLYKETDAQFATREFNYCMWQVGRCHDLQFERRRMGWLGAAIFYQFEAKRWSERALVCRARYNEAIAAIIPGTAVRWDDFFHIDRPFYVQQFGRAQRCRAIYYDDYSNLEPTIPRDALKLANSSAYSRWKTIPDPRPRPSHYQTPAEKFDNSRDVSLTLTEQMQDLIDGIGKRKR